MNGKQEHRERGEARFIETFAWIISGQQNSRSRTEKWCQESNNNNGSKWFMYACIKTPPQTIMYYFLWFYFFFYDKVSLLWNKRLWQREGVVQWHGSSLSIPHTKQSRVSRKLGNFRGWRVILICWWVKVPGASKDLYLLTLIVFPW